MSPYLPYIIKDVVTQVNEVFSTRVSDPFSVFFDHGLQADVTKNIYKKSNSGIDVEGLYPLLWLLTNTISIVRDSNKPYYGMATFDVVIAMPTDAKYTQEQRDENVFIPRLVPIYDEFLNQLSKFTNAFKFDTKNIKNRLHYRPYWGGSEAGADTKNLLGNYIDALLITGIELEMKNTVTSCLPKLITN